jgi:hypothetical protein
MPKLNLPLLPDTYFHQVSKISKGFKASMSANHNTTVVGLGLEVIDRQFQNPVYIYLQRLAKTYKDGPPVRGLYVCLSDYYDYVEKMNPRTIFFQLRHVTECLRRRLYGEMSNKVAEFNNSWNERLYAILSTTLANDVRAVVLFYLS